MTSQDFPWVAELQSKYEMEGVPGSGESSSRLLHAASKDGKGKGKAKGKGKSKAKDEENKKTPKGKSGVDVGAAASGKGGGGVVGTGDGSSSNIGGNSGHRNSPQKSHPVPPSLSEASSSEDDGNGMQVDHMLAARIADSAVDPPAQPRGRGW
jgi:hypothetical protein